MGTEPIVGDKKRLACGQRNEWMSPVENADRQSGACDVTSFFAFALTRRCARRNALGQQTGRCTGSQPTVAVLAINEFSNGKAVRHFRVRRFARAPAHMLTKKAARSCRPKDSGHSEGHAKPERRALLHCVTPVRAAGLSGFIPIKILGRDAVIRAYLNDAVTAGWT